MNRPKQQTIFKSTGREKHLVLRPSVVIAKMLTIGQRDSCLIVTAQDTFGVTMRNVRSLSVRRPVNLKGRSNWRNYVLAVPGCFTTSVLPTQLLAHGRMVCDMNTTEFIIMHPFLTSF